MRVDYGSVGEGLRRPVSLGETLLMLGGAAVLLLAQMSLGRLHPLGWLELILVFEWIVLPVSTLAHELGHAVMVARAGREAHVIVGRGPWINAKVGAVRVTFGLLTTRGVQFAGLCRYDAHGMTWRSRALIALAGPAATLLELVALLAAAPFVWGLGAGVQYATALSAVFLATSLAVNLSPRSLDSSAERALIAGRDGWQAREALRRHRERAPVETAARQVPMGQRPASVDTTRSIPPPSAAT